MRSLGRQKVLSILAQFGAGAAPHPPTSREKLDAACLHASKLGAYLYFHGAAMMLHASPSILAPRFSKQQA